MEQQLKLADSGVVFNEGTHQYFLGDKELKGITGILSRLVFPNKYDGIPAHVLAQAAKRGSHIHKMCEMVDEIGIVPEGCKEAMNYIALKDSLGLVSVAREYLVTDRARVASAIDAVYAGTRPGTVILNDLKTTSKLDKEYLSWQLSIYAYLFSLQNPDIEIEKVTATWLKDDNCEWVEIERKPVEEVKRLLDADATGGPFVTAEAGDGGKDGGGIPEYIAGALGTLQALHAKIEMYESQFNKLKAEIEAAMVERGDKSVITPVASFSYTAPRTSVGFDSSAFKKENEELYKRYCTKETAKKGYLTIKFK